jgi:hypothetical protein
MLKKEDICDTAVSEKPIPTERVLELIEASEAYPHYTRLIEPGAAYNDVAMLLRELLEHRKARSG